ncbi:MAG: hypothetical protein O2857_29065, partial [Planctomycetota bacterium]|nr:hypothetical protein [Planctomycetota bacterium]
MKKVRKKEDFFFAGETLTRLPIALALARARRSAVPFRTVSDLDFGDAFFKDFFFVFFFFFGFVSTEMLLAASSGVITTLPSSSMKA